MCPSAHNFQTGRPILITLRVTYCFSIFRSKFVGWNKLLLRNVNTNRFASIVCQPFILKIFENSFEHFFFFNNPVNLIINCYKLYSNVKHIPQYFIQFRCLKCLQKYHFDSISSRWSRE